ncbi:MAG TPA: hypothetical protein VLD37_01220 [Candidatus Bilamarchaeum sp.]|nr:hypothetical protein [Candidatus Bilamarchaeum sp.]
MKEITIIENDRLGLVADVLGILEKAGMEIVSLNIQIVTDKAIITAGLSDAEKGKGLLEAEGYEVEDINSFVVRLGKGGIGRLISKLRKCGAEILKSREICTDAEFVVYSIVVDDPARAAQTLKGLLLASRS